MRTSTRADLLGTLIGAGLDTLIADPRRGHPVAVFGGAATQLQSRLERDSRIDGMAFSTIAVGIPVLLGLVADRATRRRPMLRTVLTAGATWSALGGTSLAREARAMQGSLDSGDISAARDRLSHLCGRDPALLDEPGLIRATCESVAENTNDAVVAPLFWMGILGIPGILAFRAANTLDAMVGHRSARYERFGWASARIDDLLGWVPARITAALAGQLAPSVGGSSAQSRKAWRRDGPLHPSPNAGPVEAAFAGALGVRFGGPIRYTYGPSDRPWLNAGGREVLGSDIGRTIRLARSVSVASLAGSLILRWARAR